MTCASENASRNSPAWTWRPVECRSLAFRNGTARPSPAAGPTERQSSSPTRSVCLPVRLEILRVGRLAADRAVGDDQPVVARHVRVGLRGRGCLPDDDIERLVDAIARGRIPQPLEECGDQGRIRARRWRDAAGRTGGGDGATALVPLTQPTTCSPPRSARARRRRATVASALIPASSRRAGAARARAGRRGPATRSRPTGRSRGRAAPAPGGPPPGRG